MDFKLIAGEVTGLTTCKGYEDLLATAPVKDIGGVTAAIAASVGLASTAAALSGADSAADVDTEFFSCNVNGVPLTGRFHRVEFQNGETIDFVVTLSDGKGEVHAARDRRSRLIWTLPYRTRGHKAQLRHDLASSLIISVVGTLLLTVLMHYKRFTVERLDLIINVSSIMFSILLTVNILSRWPFYKSSKHATEIFRILGFSDPVRVNLPVMDKRAEKEFRASTGAAWTPIVPWRYRYDQTALACTTQVAEKGPSPND